MLTNEYDVQNYKSNRPQLVRTPIKTKDLPKSKPLLNKENLLHNHNQSHQRSSLAETHSRKRSQVKSNSSISKQRKKSVGNISERPLDPKEKSCHNHPGKSAEYVIIVEEEPLMYCQKCAVMLATQKFRVVPLGEYMAQGKQFSCRQGLTREQEVSNFLLSLESGSSQISGSIKSIQNRRCLIVNHYMQESKSVEEYYNKVIQQIEQWRDQTLDALEMTKTKEVRLVELYQEELGDCSKQLDAIRKDITSNYQVILHNVTESSYRPIISNYFNKLNQVKAKLKEVNELPKEAVGTQNTDRVFQQFMQGKERLQLKLRNVQLGSSRGQSRSGKGSQTPFRNLFKEWGQENSPEFSR